MFLVRRCVCVCVCWQLAAVVRNSYLRGPVRYRSESTVASVASLASSTLALAAAAEEAAEADRFASAELRPLRFLFSCYKPELFYFEVFKTLLSRWF